MKPRTADGSNVLKPNEVRLDRLLGRRVVARDGRRVGRIEEVRAEGHGTGWTVSEYVIGAAGLFERLGLGVKLLFGGKRRSFVAAWDQLDVSDPDRPRLTCPTEDLGRA
jgi:hypothetical protein